MDEKTQQERQIIAAELRKSVAQLESISVGVRKGFVGIGSEYCAQCLDDVNRKLRDVVRSLETVFPVMRQGDNQDG